MSVSASPHWCLTALCAGMLVGLILLERTCLPHLSRVLHIDEYEQVHTVAVPPYLPWQ